MKKILLLMTAMTLFSSLCYADYDDYRERDNGWEHHEHHHRHYYQQPEGRYYQQPPVVYYQQPPVVYYQQPGYSQPMRYPSNELRLHW